MTDRTALDRRSLALAVDDDCRVLCRQLRQRRERTRLNKAQLAAQIGTSREMLRHWESGAGNPTLRYFVQWARVLDQQVELYDPRINADGCYRDAIDALRAEHVAKECK